MNIVNLELQERNFFCPVTGTRIYGDDILEPSSATKGIWIGEVPDEPLDLSPEVEVEWSGYLHALEEADDWCDPEEFLSGVDKENWVAFSITTSGIACGPVSSTVWIAIDMDHRNPD